MNISKINNNTNYSNTSFKAYLPKRFYKQAEKCTFAVEKIERRALNCTQNVCIKVVDLLKKFMSKFHKNNIYQNKKNIPDLMSQLSPGVVEAIKGNPVLHQINIYKIASLLAEKKEVEINLENNELLDIVNDEQSTIFIMNHDNPKEDNKLLGFFNALLAREYLFNDKTKTCPKPRIIINKDILETASEERRLMYEILGIVGIDAGIHCADTNQNAKVFLKLIRDLVKDKTNLFIFPEGRMCAFRNLNPDWKFQTGIADLIKVALSQKECIKVIPLGFAYKEKVGSINIGKPIYLRKENEDFLFKPQEANKKFQSSDYIDFLENAPNKDGWYKITENGQKIPNKNIGNYIAGILCECLVLSKKKASENIVNVGTLEDSDTIYTLGDEFDE